MDKFLRALASAQPSPGGGSAAALVGSCGVALIEKILRILVGRPAVSRLLRIQLKSRLKILSRSSERLRDLIHEDAKAYQQWVRAHHTNRGVVQAQRRIVRTPLEMCAIVCEARKVSRWMKPWIGPLLGSDLKAADAFLDAAFVAAQSMVRINCNAPGFPPALKRAPLSQLRKNV